MQVQVLFPAPRTRNHGFFFNPDINEVKMDFVSLLLIAIALSMDAMAVSISAGIASNKPKISNVIKLALFFGFFQFLMPVIGYYLGRTVSEYIERFDHWVAFALLVFIGAKMLIEAIKNKDDDSPAGDPYKTKTLFIMAIATSIDALAVGVSFALTNVHIFSSAAVIGVVTFMLSALGVFIGRKVGSLFSKRAEILGGIILIGIGAKILIEHLFF